MAFVDIRFQEYWLSANFLPSKTPVETKSNEALLFYYFSWMLCTDKRTIQVYEIENDRISYILITVLIINGISSWLVCLISIRTF